jgi:hypothetical protein
MSGHPAVQMALRNHVFDSLGLPRLYVPVEAQPVEPPRYVTRMPGGVGGRRREASPYPDPWAFQLVSSTPMNGLKTTLDAIQNLVVCHGGMTAHGAGSYPAVLAHVR